MNPETENGLNSERVPKVVTDLIEARIKRWLLISNEHSKPKTLPEVPLPDSADLLFKSAELWIPTLDNLKVIPRLVVAELLTRKNGQEKESVAFGVFLDMQRVKIEKEWYISPVGYFPKQRNQFWPKDYVSALITRISRQLINESSRSHQYVGNFSPNDPYNPIAYTFAENVSLEKLEKTFDTAILQTMNAIENWPRRKRIEQGLNEDAKPKRGRGKDLVISHKNTSRPFQFNGKNDL